MTPPRPAPRCRAWRAPRAVVPCAAAASLLPLLLLLLRQCCSGQPLSPAAPAPLPVERTATPAAAALPPVAPLQSAPGGAAWAPGPRALLVRDTVRRAFAAYRRRAWGCDELDSRCFMATLVDALSTLWVCGLREDVFETSIRILGGLLSAGALSGDVLFLHKAREVGDALAGSVQLEFRYLSFVTSDARYDDGGARAARVLAAEARRRRGVIPPGWHNGEWTGPVTFGAYADSYYEYLLKQWLLTSRRHQ
eukprot:gene6340-28770_t